MTRRQLKRARSAEAKQVRRSELLDSAAGLLGEAEFSTIRMEDVARAAGVSKGTLYLYFKHREEIFLTLAYEGLAAWLEHVEATLRGDLSIRGPGPLARAFVATLRERPRLTRLLPLIPALQIAGASDGPSEAQAALTLCSRRVEKIVNERLIAAPGEAPAHPVALAVAVLLGIAQVSAVGISLTGYSADAPGERTDDELERVLSALFGASSRR